MINKIIQKLQELYYNSSSERYCNWLRNKGIVIGGVLSFDLKQPV